MSRGLLIGVAAVIGSLAAGLRASEVASVPDSGTAALQELRTFMTTGRVLHIGAHPDDENTQLIAYLSRGRGYDTAYLSITRGDGGQNLLGPQFDEKLGVARTQELLAARRIDGGRQFFTRAIDFGFSKNPDETLSIWNHREVLADVVRVIREFRPDIIVTRFPVPPGSGGHGHHTASAILALEAFKLAGDSSAYPEQLEQGLSPWQPKRIVWNVSGFSRGGGIESNPSVKIDIGGKDPVTGELFSSIAARSRAMHKTQGFGDFRPGSRPSIETFALLSGAPMKSDIMDGVDTTWGRVPGGREIGELADAAVARFNFADPAASVPALLEIRRRLASLPTEPLIEDKRRELDRVLQGCLGLVVESRAPTATVIPGDKVGVRATVSIRAIQKVTWIGVEMRVGHVPIGTEISSSSAATRDVEYVVPTSTPLTQPYWLQQPPTIGTYRVKDPRLIGRPENPPDLPLTYDFKIGDQVLRISDQLSWADGTTSQTVSVVPPVSLGFADGRVTVFRPGESREITLVATANRAGVKGMLRLAVPSGWSVSAPRSFSIEHSGGTARGDFTLKAPLQSESAALDAVADVGGFECRTATVEISYSHIPRQLLQPPAVEKILSVAVAIKGRHVGYLPGAGDDIPEALDQLGYHVTTLRVADLEPETLRRFDALVIGVRAFNTHSDLGTKMPAIFDFASNGGTVVCQYNWSRNLKVQNVAPYPLRISDLRVTDETAAVRFVHPESPVLNQPNKITAADFDGWVQERGVYFPSEWDDHFAPVLAMSDPGERPLEGALLVAPVGKGYFVYTGLAFFRQLPAGVPGAYRLFANLVSLGK